MGHREKLKADIWIRSDERPTLETPASNFSTVANLP